MLLCLFLTSCDKETRINRSLKVTTNDATMSYHQTSSNGVSITTGNVIFSSTYEWKKPWNRPQAFGAVLYGKTNNLSIDNNMGSTNLNELEADIEVVISAETFTLINVDNKDGSLAQSFAPGDTMYYRAYAKVIPDDGGIFYIYGEEKFTVMAGE